MHARRFCRSKSCVRCGIVKMSQQWWDQVVPLPYYSNQLNVDTTMTAVTAYKLHIWCTNRLKRVRKQA
jgi:hypothetical protein